MSVKSVKDNVVQDMLLVPKFVWLSISTVLQYLEMRDFSEYLEKSKKAQGEGFSNCVRDLTINNSGVFLEGLIHNILLSKSVEVKKDTPASLSESEGFSTEINELIIYGLIANSSIDENFNADEMKVFLASVYKDFVEAVKLNKILIKGTPYPSLKERIDQYVRNIQRNLHGSDMETEGNDYSLVSETVIKNNPYCVTFNDGGCVQIQLKGEVA